MLSFNHNIHWPAISNTWLDVPKDRCLILMAAAALRLVECDLTTELTGREHNAITGKFSMKAALFALRLNELFGCAVETETLPLIELIAY